MFNIYEKFPLRWGLGFQKDPVALIIRAHPEFVKSSLVVTEETPFVNMMQDDFGFSEIQGDLRGGHFGFNSVFRNVGQGENDLINYEILIPSLWELTEKTCPSCKGTGKDPFFEEWENKRCGSCQGQGVELSDNSDHLYAISATFNLFLLMGAVFEGNTQSPISQLLALQIGTKRDMNGCPIAAAFSPEVKKWLWGCEEERIVPEVLETMADVYYTIEISEEREQTPSSLDVMFCFRDNNRFLARCSGDATEIYPFPDDWDDDFEKPCNIDHHNIDSPSQQLVLLTALAKLHDLAWEYLYG